MATTIFILFKKKKPTIHQIYFVIFVVARAPDNFKLQKFFFPVAHLHYACWQQLFRGAIENSWHILCTSLNFPLRSIFYVKMDGDEKNVFLNTEKKFNNQKQCFFCQKNDFVEHQNNICWLKIEWNCVEDAKRDHQSQNKPACTWQPPHISLYIHKFSFNFV